MTPEQMLAAWIEAGRPIAEFRSWHHDFANLIRNATLEEAASLCEAESKQHNPSCEDYSHQACIDCSDAIRAMKTKDQS